MKIGKQLLKTPEAITGLFSKLCSDSNSLSARFCHGILDRLTHPVSWLFSNSPLGPTEICSTLLGSTCLKYLDPPTNNSTVIILQALSSFLTLLFANSCFGKSICHHNRRVDSSQKCPRSHQAQRRKRWFTSPTFISICSIIKARMPNVMHHFAVG